MRTSSVRTWLASATAALLLAAAPVVYGAEPVEKPAAKAAAQAAPPTREELEQRIQELEDSVKQLRTDTRQLEVKNDETARNKPTIEWKDGFTLNTPEGDFKLRLGGYTQADGRFFVNGQPAKSQFVLRRARIIVGGTLFKYFDFRIMPDFGLGTTVLFDAYLNVKYFPEANFWFGKYKAPVGIERLQSALALDFVERSLANNLIPNRDLGAAFQGTFFNGAFNYAVGVFDGDADGGSVNTNPDSNFDFDGRIFALPFKDRPIEALRGLGLGISGTYGDRISTPTNTQLPIYVTSLGQQTFFSYVADNPATVGGTAVAHGILWRYSPQAYWYWGPFGSMYSFAQSSTGITKGTTNGRVNNYGWHAQFVYVLTGENASYAGVTPAENFNPLVGTWGAFQVGFRYDGFKADNDAFVLGFADSSKSAGKATGATFGLNWYWNKAVMLALDYGQTWFQGGNKGNTDRRNEDVLTTRVQFNY